MLYVTQKLSVVEPFTKSDVSMCTAFVYCPRLSTRKQDSKKEVYDYLFYCILLEMVKNKNRCLCSCLLFFW